MINEIVMLIEKKLRLNGQCIVALDGRCGSGKTTLAEMLKGYFDCNEKRKEDRIGNLDTKRLKDEVIEPLKERKSFSYRPYLCMKGTFLEAVEVESKSVAIIEGSYSCQSELFDFYDIHIFLDIDKNTQQKRLKERESEEKLVAFNERWIPMEERYFALSEIKYKCEIYYKTSV